MNRLLPPLAVAVALVLSDAMTESFSPAALTSRTTAVVFTESKARALTDRFYDCQALNSDRESWRLYQATPSENENDSPCGNNGAGAVIPKNSYVQRWSNRLRKYSKPVALSLITATATSLPNFFLRPPSAHASAPIVLRPAKPKEDPPMVQAMKKAEQLKKQTAMEEFDRFMQTCNDIEDSEGKKARDEYEKQYNLEEEKKKKQKTTELENLKRDLLAEGQDPFTDMDAERKVFMFEHGIDLEKIPGTPQNEQMIKNFQSRGKNKPTFASQRFIIKCQVADLAARGIDPLEHFAKPEVQEKTHAIYKMENRMAAKVAKQYEGLMEQYSGRLTPPKEGEVPFVRSTREQQLAELEGGSGDSSKQSSKDQKVKLAKEKAAAKAKAKAKLLAEKEATKKEKEAQRLTKAEARSEAKASRAAEKKRLLEENAEKKRLNKLHNNQKNTKVVVSETQKTEMAAQDEVAAPIETTEKIAVSESTPLTKKESSKSFVQQIKGQATVRNVVTVAIGASATVFGYNYYTENNSAAQLEREQQLKLIMGVSDDEDDDDDLIDDGDNDIMGDDITQKEPTSKASTSPKPDAKENKPAKPTSTPFEPLPSTRVKPKRKLGIFSKKKANARETDLNVLISPSAPAPEFAFLLSQILTFGAPGRFPAISAMGEMPLDEFESDKAKAMLMEKRLEMDLSDEQSAEIFASVVNCMIIDIVDLASSTLKGNDDKVTVEAIDVVMDFMDHAASLFDAVAKDVTITPVTYGGNLGRKQLEQMFSTYASSTMMSLDGSSQDRVDTLQLVFGISDKKAEGLMQKSMMKMLMKMMKDGGKGMEGMPGMEGMEEMMKAFGGESGFPGMAMPGMDGEMSPEDLKQTVKMMKDLMDSGQVSHEELAEVRKQFKEMYGSDIADLIRKADQEGTGADMGEDEKELLDVFKQILGE